MSERGRGSEPLDDDLGGNDAADQPASADLPRPPTAPRPIAPYDPYRPTGAAASAPRRNVAAEGIDLRRSRGADRGPFLSDQDPLNAEAWQLELDELDELDASDDELDFGRIEPVRPPQPAPRRTRRPAPAPERPRRESAAGAGRRRGARPETAARQRPAVTLTVPRAVSGSSLVADQTMLALLGINIGSVLVMALVLGVRLGSLPAATALRLDAAGNPALWGPPSVLWRLPLMAFFITAMFLAVAWFVHPRDRFAARFALAAAAVAQVIAWAAVILHLG